MLLISYLVCLSVFDFVRAKLLGSKGLPSLSEVINRLHQASLFGTPSVSTTRIVMPWFLLVGALIHLAVAPTTLLARVSLVVVEVVMVVLLVLVVEEVVDVLLVTMCLATGVVVTHKNVLIVIMRITPLIIVGIFTIVRMPIRLHFLLMRLPPMILLLRLCLFHKRSIIDC